MELKFKRLSENAVLPIRVNKNDAGLDLTATRITQEINECGQLILVYHTDLAVEIPEGYVGLLFSRSSIFKKSLMLCNAVGVIDSGYHGEIIGKLRSTTDVVPAIYKPGEKFAQLIIMPIADVTVTETTELSDSERGENGFGSSGDTSAATLPQATAETDSEQAAVATETTESAE